MGFVWRRSRQTNPISMTFRKGTHFLRMHPFLPGGSRIFRRGTPDMEISVPWNSSRLGPAWQLRPQTQRCSLLPTILSAAPFPW